MKTIEEQISTPAHVSHALRRSEKLYFPALDGLRFFAFLLVFVHHLPRSTEPVLALLHDQGWVGVHVFLFLSAFLLTAILRAEQDTNGKISIRNFYIRRGLRIWPLYFVFCFGTLLLSNALHPERSVEWFRFGGLMFFVDNIVSGFSGYNPIPYAGHLWTISLEEQFYLVLPLVLSGLLAAAPARLLRGLLVCWFVFLGLRITAVLLQAPHPMIWTSVVSADSLLLGTALGAMRPSPPSKVFLRLMVVIGTVGLFSGAFLPAIDKVGAHQVIIYSLIAVGAAALTMAALHEPLFGFLKRRPFQYLGKISYGLYVFHFVGIAVASKLASTMGWTSWAVSALTAFVATTFCSVLSYELFERQFLKLKQRFETVHSRPI